MSIYTKTLGMGVLAAAISGLSGLVVAQEEVAENITEQGNGEEVEEELIVTGVAQPVSKLESSNSVTALPADDIQNFTPRSTAEIFRNLPGIQSEATGGDANANIKVRGLPISAGGARYLSIQEDNLPVLLIGDMDFATSDSFLRFDNNIDSVQAIRGGAGATQAPNSPGGIVNFLSNTGDVEGGSVALTTGVDYDSNRIDLSYGKPLDNGWRYHVGGYYREGEGARDVPGDLEKGYQVKGNATKELDNGFVRINVKRLDERTPTYLPVPARYTGGGSYDEVGVDFGDGTLYLQGQDPLVREGGVQSKSLTSGFEADVTSIGIESQVDLNDATSVGFAHRYSSVSGGFVSPFPAEVYTNSEGPAVRIHYFNTQLDSLDNAFTDLNISHDIGAVNVKAGVFRGSQDYVTQWGWNTYFVQLDGGLTPTQGPSGEPSFSPGHALWGNCCQRSYDLEIENIAPYAVFTGDIGESMSWDASVRQDYWKVDGNYAFASGTLNSDGFPVYDTANPVDYDIDYTSWSLGLNYALNDNSAVFFNVSEGGSATAPSRVTASLLANGDLNDEKSGYSTVEQREVGFKYRGDNASLYVTLFDTDTVEAGGFEVTSQTVIENSYSSSGVEIEGDYLFGGGFALQGSVTITDAEITESNTAANEGNTPRRQADYIFNITPSYTGDKFNTGFNFVGTDEVYVQDDNNAKLDGFIVTNFFFNYSYDESITVSFNVNNLLDEEGFTEGEDGNPAVGDFVRVRPINGRTASLNLRYSF